MKAFILSLTLATLSLFMCLTSSAQTPDDFTGALLWKVSGNGLSKPSYIFGSHHLVHVSFVDSVTGLPEILRDTEQVIGELVMSEQAQMATKLQGAAMMPAGVTYSDLLSPEELAKLDEGLKDMFTVGLEQLGMMHPAVLSIMHTITLYGKFYPEFNPMSHEAIDAYVQRVAKEKGKDVFGLETVEDQIKALFEAEPIKAQAEALACIVINNQSAKEELDKLNHFYRQQDLTGLYSLTVQNTDDPCPFTLEQKNALMKNRNNNWMTKLPEMIKDRSSLVVVGALHLPGEEGLLYQLAKSGYKVEAVR